MQHFVRIREWSKYQHYKDRNPPWIKLHREILTSRTWAESDDQNRVLAIACMMLAAATDNKIPASPSYIKRVAYLNHDPDFSHLVNMQFIEIIDENGSLLADASKLHTNVRPETETETEEETYKPEKIKPSARKTRRAQGSPNGSQVCKTGCESRHDRSHQLIMGWYQDWAGVQCPWDGGEGKQLKSILTAWPDVTDEQFVRCLDNIALSDCIPKGDRPREWLGKMPKFVNGPLDQFWKPKGNGNGNSKDYDRNERNKAAILRGIAFEGSGTNAADYVSTVPNGDHVRLDRLLAGSIGGREAREGDASTVGVFKKR